MDVRESKERRVKNLDAESSRHETTRRSQTREISSRYRSPTPVTPPGPHRYPSPSVTRAATPSRQSVPKRAVSAERKRPSTAASPPRPSTPVQDTLLDKRLASRKLTSSKMPEGLWPSTMRSLGVSFQSDAFLLPILKKEKPIPKSPSDRALRPSSNVSHIKAEKPVVTRTATPERKRSPLKGKNGPDLSENSKPVDVVHARLVEQHRWPSRTSGKLSSGALTRSMDLTDRSTKIPSPRKMFIPDGMSKTSQKSSSDVANLSSGHSKFGLFKPVSSHFWGGMSTAKPGIKSQSLPTTPGGSRASSPSKATISLSSVSRGTSPSRTRAVSSTSRSVSPAHSRPSSPSRQSSISTTSVLSFVADIKKGKKAANHIEDAHELRLLYNKHLQWRYANARANAVLHTHKVKAKKMLYNVWETMSTLWDFVVEKRIDLEQLRLKLKLHTVLREQGDIESVKAAVCSAIDVIRAVGSSISFILARVERMNSLVSELADVARRERAMVDGCEALLASIAALQAEEDSLRTHLIQIKES